MANLTRSSRGELVNFELLALKAQLAATPVPSPVQERRIAIEEREGIKQPVVLETEELTNMLAVNTEAAATSEKVAPKRK